MMKAEQWRAVPNTNGKIEVSDHGRVRSWLRDGRFLKVQSDKKGYQRLRVTIERKKMTFKLHRLVAELFIPNPSRLPQVNHKDGNKHNNYASNLEWVTCLENARHAVKCGLWENVLEAAARNHEAQRKPIDAVSIATGEILHFSSMGDAERAIGTKHINACIKGERRQACGYIFRYAEGR